VSDRGATQSNERYYHSVKSQTSKKLSPMGDTIGHTTALPPPTAFSHWQTGRTDQSRVRSFPVNIRYQWLWQMRAYHFLLIL